MLFVVLTAVLLAIDSLRFRRLFERTIRARHETLVAGERSFALTLVPDDPLLVALIRE